MTRIILRIPVLVALLFFLAAPLFAQSGSSAIFPGITSNDTLTIGNFNPQSTTATIAFYDSSGKLSSLTVELASGTQTRVNATTLALNTFTGSVVVTGPLPLAVSADRFEGGTGFDFFNPSESSTSLIIPLVPSGAT